jgi:hypothetical protein
MAADGDDMSLTQLVSVHPTPLRFTRMKLFDAELHKTVGMEHYQYG